MAVPRHSHTRSKVGKTRMHKYVKRVHLILCPKCKKAVLPHTVCLNCGSYKGKEVVDVLGKLAKKEKKIRESQIKEAGKEDQKQGPLSMSGLSKK